MELLIAIGFAGIAYVLNDKLNEQIDELRQIRILLEEQIHPPEY